MRRPQSRAPPTSPHSHPSFALDLRRALNAGPCPLPWHVCPLSLSVFFASFCNTGFIPRLIWAACPCQLMSRGRYLGSSRFNPRQDWSMAGPSAMNWPNAVVFFSSPGLLSFFSCFGRWGGLILGVVDVYFIATVCRAKFLYWKVLCWNIIFAHLENLVCADHRLVCFMVGLQFYSDLHMLNWNYGPRMIF